MLSTSGVLWKVIIIIVYLILQNIFYLPVGIYLILSNEYWVINIIKCNTKFFFLLKKLIAIKNRPGRKYGRKRMRDSIYPKFSCANFSSVCGLSENLMKAYVLQQIL